MAVEFEKLSKTNALDLLRAANKKLLGELNSEQQTKYADEFIGSGWRLWLRLGWRRGTV